MLLGLIDEIIRQFFRIVSGRGNMQQARQAVKRRMARDAERKARQSARKAVTDRQRNAQQRRLEEDE
jgi:hypothetical protein